MLLFSCHYLFLLLFFFQTLLHCQVSSVHLQVFICMFCVFTRVINALDAPFPTPHCGHSFQALFYFCFVGLVYECLSDRFQSHSRIHTFTTYLHIHLTFVCLFVCVCVCVCIHLFTVNAPFLRARGQQI